MRSYSKKSAISADLSEATSSATSPPGAKPLPAAPQFVPKDERGNVALRYLIECYRHAVSQSAAATADFGRDPVGSGGWRRCEYARNCLSAIKWCAYLVSVLPYPTDERHAENLELFGGDFRPREGK